MQGAAMAKAKPTKKAKKKTGGVIYAPDDDGNMVKVVLSPPLPGGKISIKRIDAAIKAYIKEKKERSEPV